MERKEFIKSILGIAAMTTLGDFKSFTNNLPEQDEEMPVLFIGHGSPMNAIEDNEFTKGWKAIAKTIAKPKLYPTFKQFSKIEPFVSQAFVCMAPSSVWFTKQLPKDKWIELCNSIPKEVVIYLLGGPSDKTLCEEIKNKSTHESFQILAGELSLLESCELMKHAKMNYVNDSGPLHLASAGNSPTTAFFCSTIPKYGFYPLAYNSNVIEVRDLYCKPCGLHGYKTCPKNNFRCGNEIKLPLFK
jgi:heptosyltransferase-2